MAPSASVEPVDPALARVRALLARSPLIDGHNDLPWTIREKFGSDLAKVDLRKRGATADTDLPRLREGMVSGQFWSVWIPSGLSNPARTQLEQIELTRRMIDAYPDDLLFATRAADVERARSEGKIASFLGMENGQALENSLGGLRAFYDLGVRYLTLTHGRNTDWADSATQPAGTPMHGGLTAFGREVVREMNRLGMLVDISHVSPDVMRQVLDISEAPVIFSHSSARALVDHARNVPDDVLARMAKNGGVVMVTFIPPFVSAATEAYGRPLEARIQGATSTGEMDRLIREYEAAHGPAPTATLAQVADHIDHVARVAGHDHVGIGSDFWGTPPMPDGLEDVSRFPHLLAELVRRGWSDENLAKLAGGNILRALAGAETAAARLRASRPASNAAFAAPPGLDLEGMDPKIAPGDDFFGYANGGWLERTEIPADRSSYGAFAILAEEADRRTAELIREAGAPGDGAPTPERRMVADFYAAWMDEAAIERLGLAPVRSDLEAVDRIADKSALARHLGGELRADVDPLNSTDFFTDRLFGLWVSPDFDDTGVNAAYLLQGGLGLPNRQNYLADDQRAQELQASYRDYLEKLLVLSGRADGAGAKAQAGRIYALERKIAGTHASRLDSLDVQKARNRWRRAELATKAPGLDWSAWLAGAGLEEVESLWIWHPGAVTGAAALVASEPLSTWKEYLAVRVLDRAAPLLPKAYVEAEFALRGTALGGATRLRERWKRAVDATNAQIGDAVGRMYVERYFPPEAKATAEKMVRDIIDSFRRRVDELDWMSPVTRSKAKEKLGTLRVGVGYPATFTDYSGLEVRPDDALGNARRAQVHHYRGELALIGKPADKDRWWMTPQTVNAVNLPLQNAMNFPAAILSPPFFDPSTDIAQNYGGIGAVIGHEISHSFDDQGALFDAQGRLANWWTAEDMTQFEARAARLVAQYDAYEPLPGAKVNGKLTLSENIADVAGVGAAFDAYRRARSEGASARALNQGFTDDQRFFLSYAQIWRGKARPEAQRQALLTNSHAPGRYRSSTVRNLATWYEAFGVKPGQGLYLAPEERVRIW